MLPVWDAVEDTPVAVAVCDAPDTEAEADESSDCATNGFELLPPVPEVRSRENVVSMLCCWIEAEASSVSKASPLRDA